MGGHLQSTDPPAPLPSQGSHGDGEPGAQGGALRRTLGASLHLPVPEEGVERASGLTLVPGLLPVYGRPWAHCPPSPPSAFRWGWAGALARVQQDPFKLLTSRTIRSHSCVFLSCQIGDNLLPWQWEATTAAPRGVQAHGRCQSVGTVLVNSCNREGASVSPSRAILRA